MSERDLIVNNLDACWSSVVKFLGEIDSSQWQHQSLCPEWTIKGVAAHLVSVEQVLSNWMPSSPDRPPPFEKVAEYFPTAMEMPEEELVAHMQETFDVRRENLSNTSDKDFEQPSITPVGPATYGRFMAVREFDFWMHERDCRTPLDAHTDNGGPPAEMALNEVHLSIGYIAGKKIGLTQGQSIHFDITGSVERDIYVGVDDRATELEFIDEPTVILHCDSMAFMNQACGRIDPEIPIAEGAITWSGDDELGAHAARNLRFTM
ncbi:MAG: maleylpyruvate isomerase N-terminal domain-containing protein [Acidimicrobiales bacterium]|nr:maleylpyruvate isomerase N-terminal domain-containing protein [Acidimicrobiales bacterium]